MLPDHEESLDTAGQSQAPPLLQLTMWHAGRLVKGTSVTLAAYPPVRGRQLLQWPGMPADAFWGA